MLVVRVRFGVVSNAMAPKPYEPPFPKACQAEWRDPATAEEEGSDPAAGMAATVAAMAVGASRATSTDRYRLNPLRGQCP